MPGVLFLLGVALMVAGVALVSVPAALVVSGLACMAAAADLRRDRKVGG